jgi:hypothetical protein
LLDTKARLTLELALSTAGRRKDIVWLGPQHVEDGIVTFEQSKTEGTDDAHVSIPLDPSFFEALAAMSSSKIVPLSVAPTFLTTAKVAHSHHRRASATGFVNVATKLGCRRDLVCMAFAKPLQGGEPRGDALFTRSRRSQVTQASAKSKDTQRPPTRSDLRCRPKRSSWRTERKHQFTNLRERFVALNAKSLKMHEHKMRMVCPGGLEP